MKARLIASILLPFVICAVQWWLWDYFKPFVWFLFFPVAYFSSWIGGLRGGIAATITSALLVWYVFIPPQFSFAFENPASAFSIVVFVCMGFLFAYFFERLRKAMQNTGEQLHMSDARFEATFEQAAVGIVQMAPAGNFLRVNRKFTDILGYTEQELLNKSFRDITYPDDLAESIQHVRSMQEGKTQNFSAEKRYLHKDGSVVWGKVAASVIGKSDGRPEYMIAVVENITDRKLAEEEIRQLNINLEKRIDERTAELTNANRELDSFAYAVSHDLRAPLRALSGFSQALNEDYGNQLQGDAKVFLEQIDIASHKMGDLIDGILTLSRSSRGELQRDDIDLSALSKQLLEEMARDEPQRKVIWQVDPNLNAKGDRRMIEAALSNLLGNAWKYTTKTESPAIRVFVGEVDGLRGFCISDNGAGFEMSHANQLFQPFRRLHRQDEFPGIGIGLATVQRIILRHGGEIRAVGKPGSGATFCFSLPADTPMGAS